MRIYAMICDYSEAWDAEQLNDAVTWVQKPVFHDVDNDFDDNRYLIACDEHLSEEQVRELLHINRRGATVGSRWIGLDYADLLTAIDAEVEG